MRKQNGSKKNFKAATTPGKVTPAMVKQMKALRKKGESYAAIGASLTPKVSHAAVRYHCL